MVVTVSQLPVIFLNTHLVSYVQFSCQFVCIGFFGKIAFFDSRRGFALQLAMMRRRIDIVSMYFSPKAKSFAVLEEDKGQILSD